MLKDMRYDQSPADPCLMFSWNMTGLIIWLNWIDDCLIAGDERGVKAAQEQIKERFGCNDVGLLTECISCKNEHDEASTMMNSSARQARC